MYEILHQHHPFPAPHSQVRAFPPERRMERDTEALMEMMNVSREKALLALQKAGGIEQAMNLLLSGAVLDESPAQPSKVLSFIESPFTTKAEYDVWRGLPPAKQPFALAKAAGDILIELPAGFFNVAPGSAFCKAVNVASGRSFGLFPEKTLACNNVAKQAFDQMCWEGGFTQAWEGQPGPDGFLAMTKIPVILLIKLMLGLPPEAEEQVKSLTGAFAICMDPYSRTCMNVIVGRHPAPSPSGQMSFAVDKFSLYYPDNAAMEARCGMKWPLLQGYSFRTAVLNGHLNRGDLSGLRRGSIPVEAGTRFEAADHGLIIDGASEYEDCAYVELRPDATCLTASTRRERPPPQRGRVHPVRCRRQEKIQRPWSTRRSTTTTATRITAKALCRRARRNGRHSTRSCARK